MHKIQDILYDKITLDIECVDRVYLNGYVKNLQLPGGVVNFIQQQFNWPIPSPKAMYKMSDRFREAVDEFAKQQLRQQGIGFEPLSNGFAVCDDPACLQNICYQLDEVKVQALFDHWVEQLPWPLTHEQRAAGYKHLLSIWQMEVSRTQVFLDAEQGRALVENLIRENLDLGRPHRISLIFDRKVTKANPSEFHTRVIREGVLPSIRVRYKYSALKQYFKDGRALRTETMINNPYDFGFIRNLSQFSYLFQLGRQINNRLLEQEYISQDCFLPLDEVRHLNKSTVLDDGQRASSLGFGDPRVMSLFAAIVNHAYLPGELRNKTIRRTVSQLMGVSDGDYNSAQMSYDLRRLRLKGLIERISNSHSYRLTELGVKAATFFVKLYERLFRPGLAALIPYQAFPSDLAKSLKNTSDILDKWIDNAYAQKLKVKNQKGQYSLTRRLHKCK